MCKAENEVHHQSGAYHRRRLLCGLSANSQLKEENITSHLEWPASLLSSDLGIDNLAK